MSTAENIVPVTLDEGNLGVAGEGSSSPGDMDGVEITPPSPTSAAQQSLQKMGIGEKEKYQKELVICSKLLDQVKGYFGFDRVTRAKAKETVTHHDLDRALQCSSHVALKHAEAFNAITAQRVQDLEDKAIDQDTMVAVNARIKQLEDEVNLLKGQIDTNTANIATNVTNIKAAERRITSIENVLRKTEGRIAAGDTNIQLDQEQYNRLRSDIYKSLSYRVHELSIEEHKRKLVIYGLETTDYNVQANNRQIYKSIVQDANMRDQLPENCTLRVDFLGRRTHG